jgi:AcrR family transcriptional regulator
MDKERSAASEKVARVLEAARVVFIRYGFRRVTMQDIADEAGISRPALYLVFANKEEVFFATIRDLSAEMLHALHEGLPAHNSLEAKLQFAFEVWTVQSYATMQSSPNARDLIECVELFARDTVNEVNAQFEALLAEVLATFVTSPIASADGTADLDARKIARLLASAAHGSKETAAGVEDLRAMIHGMITLTTAALRQ